MIAISSAFKNAIVAIDINGKKDYCQLDSNAKHAESLLPALDNLLEKNNVRLEDNKNYCVIVGPGSFTGLRIGIALVKGLIQGGDEANKIYPITSFDLMAYSYIKHNHPENNFTCVLNALSGLFFVCEYDKNGKKIGKERIIDGEELDKIDLLKISLKEEELTREQVEFTAKDLLEYALIQEKEGESCLYNELVPLYLRKSQAEAALEQKIRQKI